MTKSKSYGYNDKIYSRKEKNLQKIKDETDKFCVFSHPTKEKGKLKVATMGQAFDIQMYLALEYEKDLTIAEDMGKHSISHRNYQLDYLSKNNEIKLFDSKLQAQMHATFYQSKNWVKDQISKVKNLFKKHEVFEYDLDLDKAYNTHATFKFKGK